MASTYTPSLKIELMATGDQVNDWGTTTNSNLENGLEQAIVGRGVVEYTSDANKTITLTESNSSQDARNLFLYVDTDAFTTLTATRDLIVPTIEKTYVVHNDTAGSQSIRVKTSGGTGITIPNGKKALLYVDGTNVIEQLNYLTSAEIGTITFTNPVPIASGGTNAISASAARTSLGLAIGTDVQAYNAGLQDISGLAKANNNFIVGDGTNWVAESGAAVRTSLGLGSMAVQDSNAVSISAGTATLTSMTTAAATITGGTITGITDLAVADGGTGSSSLTLNSVLIGNGTSALLAVAPSTAGNVLTSNGTTWASTAPAATVNSFSAGTTGLTPSTTTTGAVTLAGTLAVANGGTGVTTSTGTGAGVHSVGPSISSAVMTTMASSVITSATAQTAPFTPTTSADFTGIPSWVKRITVMFVGCSTSGTSFKQIQLITGVSTVVTTGYASYSSRVAVGGTGTSNNSATTGFIINSDAATDVMSGNYSFTNATGNTWTGVGSVYDGVGGEVMAGGIALAAALTGIRITTVNGTDTFDAGSVNILYE